MTDILDKINYYLREVVGSGPNANDKATLQKLEKMIKSNHQKYQKVYQQFLEDAVDDERESGENPEDDEGIKNDAALDLLGYLDMDFKTMNGWVAAKKLISKSFYSEDWWDKYEH